MVQRKFSIEEIDGVLQMLVNQGHLADGDADEILNVLYGKLGEDGFEKKTNKSVILQSNALL